MADQISAPRASHFQHGSGGRSEELRHFESIVADAGEGVVILEAGVVAYANSAAVFLLGQGRSSLIGELFGLPLSPTDEGVTVNVIAEDKSLRVVEMRVERLDGDKESTVLRLRDVTDCQRRVTAAQNEVRRRDEFLAMLSHELRNPLAAIRDATSLLAIEELDESSRTEAHTIIDRQFKHLARILDDLLDVARVLRGKLALSRSRVSLNQILQDALEAIQPLMDGRGQTLNLELPDQTIWLWADETRLEQLVVNLLHNAAKFAPQHGTVGLTVSTTEKQVTVCVSDDGPGVPPELRATLFDAFVQGKQSLDRSDGGLGIGLMLVRQFAELHGGSVACLPREEGHGSCFTVTLPLLGLSDPLASSQAAACPSKRLRVLIVEDMADVRSMLKKLLISDGYEVLEAGTGPQGLSALLREPLDVALVDIGLPELNGYEVITQFRDSGPARTPRLVAVTGYGRPEDVDAARQAGFDYHLVKPVQISVLRKLLNDLARDGNHTCAGNGLTDLQTTQ